MYLLSPRLSVALSLYVKAGQGIALIQLAQHLCLFWVFIPRQVLGQSVILTQMAGRQFLAAISFRQALM